MESYEKICNNNGFWKVLIVDDDNFIHRMIKEINKDLQFEKRRIEFISAYNSDEAKEILLKDNNIALVLMDIFLEEENSGLNLAKYIREDLKNSETRIVLITGRGSMDLQEEIILNYDINGYESKTDLFSKKMNTVILSSLRSYRDIIRIKNNKESMGKVVSSISKLYEKDALNDFLSSSICHLSALINQCSGRGKENCNINAFAALKQEYSNIFKIVDAKGKYKNYIGSKVREVVSYEDLSKINRIYRKGDHKLFENCYIASYKGSSGNEAIIFIEVENHAEYIDLELLEVFHKSISATFENLCLNIEIEETQKELLYILGEVTEARSAETGYHVRRVSKYCEILAQKYGLPQRDVILLTHASPIHDIGKIAIPDSILMKPGKLTPEEFEIVKTHTTIGYNLLKNSKREILKAAAIVAHEHHERYDGTGYPRGLKGEEIHIYGRIAAVADVFDALGSARVYKKPWVINDILKYFKDERGKHFDPDLVDILFDNLDLFVEIRNTYSDEIESNGKSSDFESN